MTNSRIVEHQKPIENWSTFTQIILHKSQINIFFYEKEIQYEILNSEIPKLSAERPNKELEMYKKFFEQQTEQDVY